MAIQKKYPDYIIRITKVRLNKTVIEFCRNNLCVRDIKYSDKLGYYIQENISYKGLNIEYQIVFGSKNIDKIFLYKYPRKFRIRGYKDGFGIKIVSENVYVPEYKFHPEVNVFSKRRDQIKNVVLTHHITGNYHEYDINIDVKHKRTRLPKGTEANKKDYARPMVSKWGIEHPYSGGRFSPK